MFGSEDKKEIGRLWQRLTALEKAYDDSIDKIKILEESIKSAPVSQQEAKKAANSAIQYRSQVKKHKESAQADAESIQKLLNQFQESFTHIEAKNKLIHELEKECSQSKESVGVHCSEVDDLSTYISGKVANLQHIISENDELSIKLEHTHQLMQDSEIDSGKIKLLLKDAASSNKNIKAINDEIYGYILPNDEIDDGDPEVIEGLKDKLENSYNGLNENIEESKEILKKLTEATQTRYEETVENINNNYNKFIDGCGKKYEQTHTRIKKLLPDALTAGLSSAYDDKKKEEEITQKNAISSFKLAIIGMIIISLIPFGIDVYLIVGLKEELIKVVSDTPKLLISILPLYFPVLWMAYSSNKKANLSKRLIEEYTHKGVLSKTFEGLSTQIADIDQSDISNELRVKLLFNLLEVNSENPGKLISNYNSTDHPLMDALDKSAKLADSVEKLSKIPGFSKLAANLERKSKKILDAADKRVSAVLDDQINNENTEEPKVKSLEAVE